MGISVTIYKAACFVAEAQVEAEKKLIRIRLEGKLDENAGLQKVSYFVSTLTAEAKYIEFDASEIEGINSSGIRAWIQCLDRIERAGFTYSFAHLSEEMVEKATAFPNILGPIGTRVDQFEAPYFCEKCESRSIRILRADGFKPGSIPIVPPAASCESCKGVLILDVPPDDYFSFLYRMWKIKPPV